MRRLFETIAAEADGESPLWGACLLDRDQRELIPVFSPLADGRFALGIESIYEGYLLHYGRPRLFGPGDRDTAVLLGDYLYAHGLVRIAGQRDEGAVAALAELISLCTGIRAEGGAGVAAADGPAWAATVATLLDDGEALAAARRALVRGRDPGPLEELARAEAGAGKVERALALHRERVE